MTTTRANAPVAVARLHPTDPSPRDAAAWTGHMNRLLGSEIRAAVARRVITPAEADQLISRLALVIDQAITSARP